MSTKHHELNILKNVLEKADGISARLHVWASDLIAHITAEIAKEDAEAAKLSAQSSMGGAILANPLVGGIGATLVGAGAPAHEPVQEPPQAVTSAPADPINPSGSTAPVMGEPENPGSGEVTDMGNVPSPNTSAGALNGDAVTLNQPEAPEASAPAPTETPLR